MFQFISKSNLLDAHSVSWVMPVLCHPLQRKLVTGDGMPAASLLFLSLACIARKSWLLIVSSVLFPLPSLLPFINISTADHQTSGILMVSLLLSCPQCWAPYWPICSVTSSGEFMSSCEVKPTATPKQAQMGLKFCHHTNKEHTQIF